MQHAALDLKADIHLKSNGDEGLEDIADFLRSFSKGEGEEPEIQNGGEETKEDVNATDTNAAVDLKADMHVQFHGDEGLEDIADFLRHLGAGCLESVSHLQQSIAPGSIAERGCILCNLSARPAVVSV